MERRSIFGGGASYFSPQGCGRFVAMELQVAGMQEAHDGKHSFRACSATINK